MSEAFDAYHEWLGIPPREQPPTAYRLLGIDLFEGNPNVIANAAERQIVYVRSRQLGRHQQAAQGLLNEISSARVLLLDPRRKAEYDAGLAAARQPALVPPVAAPAVAAMPAAAPPVAKPSAFVPASAGPPGALVWGLAAAGGLFVAGIGLLAWHASTTASPPKTTPAASHERSEEPNKPPGPMGVLPPPAHAPIEEEPDPVPEKKKPAKPGKKPKKGKGREVDPEADSVTRDKSLPPPKGEKELEAGLGGLADSLLDKMSKPPATPKPLPPKAIPPAPVPLVTDAADAAKMSYAAEPMANGGIRVTIHDTPLGTATMLLDGDFTPGSTHNFNRRVPPDAAPADQHTLEVDVVGGKVTRVVWDKHEVKRKP